MGVHEKCEDGPIWRLTDGEAYAGPRAGYNDTTFDATVSSEITFEVSPGGQLCIPARINGQFMGPWVLDTGASGNVVTKSVAEKLGLKPFGEESISVVGGFSKGSFVQVENFTAGPMTVSNSVFAVMDVRDDIAGIVGYEFFSRVILQIDNDVGPFGANKRRAFIHDPRNFVDLASDGGDGPRDLPAKLAYAPLVFISRLPHVEAIVKAKGNFSASRNLMMFDLGAGGYSLFFNKAKAHAKGIYDDATKMRQVDGVRNAGGDIVQAMDFAIDYVDIGGVRVSGRKTTATLLDTEIDVSTRSNGILCMKLLYNCQIVIDYQRRQIGITKISVARSAST